MNFNTLRLRKKTSLNLKYFIKKFFIIIRFLIQILKNIQNVIIRTKKKKNYSIVGYLPKT